MQSAPQSVMILLFEFHGVVALRLIICRVAVDEGIFTVELPDQLFKVLVPKKGIKKAGVASLENTPAYFFSYMPYQL